MNIRSIPVLLPLVLLIAAASAYASGEQQVIKISEKGFINWTLGLVQGKGISAPENTSRKISGEDSTALRDARRDASRNILDEIQRIQVDATATVKDIALENDVIMAEIEEMVRKAQEVKNEYLSDGTVVLTMQMSLRGGFAQLILPQDIKQVETIKPMTPVQKTPPSTAPELKASSENHVSPIYTGLIVDARGLDARPAMSFKIFDESGQEVYGSAFVSREFAVQEGMSGYLKDLATAQSDSRVADNPLTVKGLRTQGIGNSNIVISNADASKIRSASEHLSFLKKCRVIIVID
jgi:hypothetical protein